MAYDAVIFVTPSPRLRAFFMGGGLRRRRGSQRWQSFLCHGGQRRQAAMGGRMRQHLAWAETGGLDPRLGGVG